MQRHPALQDLSRDHHVVLSAIVGVRRAAEADRFAKPWPEAAAPLLHLAAGPLPEHLREEEACLLPLLEGAERAGHRERLLREHAELRAALASLSRASSPAAAHAVGKALQAHIRWEEEDLFEAVQAWLGPAGLDALGARLEAMRRAAGMPVGPYR